MVKLLDIYNYLILQQTVMEMIDWELNVSLIIDLIGSDDMAIRIYIIDFFYL
jgi:hypothetical protein